jgi:hypothetical protein
MSILQFISTTVWKHLFGKGADSLERSIDNADEYMIFDNNTITSTFLSSHQISADAYISGIVAGVLEGAGFSARVTAHSVAADEVDRDNTSGGGMNKTSGYVPGLPKRKDRAVFLVKFSEKVLERDAALANR